MKKKLRSRRGFSLSEMLVTTLIVGLLSAGVATGVSASLRVYRESKQLSEAQMLCSTLSEAVIDELHFATDIDASDNTFTSSRYGSGVSISPSSDPGEVTIGKNKLIGSGVYCGGELCATVEYSYVDVFTVTVSVYSSADRKNPITEATFNVTPLNA